VFSIHQTDAHLKLQGIKNIQGFLVNSDEMVMLLDNTYVTRVWCMFEVAVYLSVRDNPVVNVVPIGFYSATLIMSFSLIVMFTIVIPFYFVSGAYEQSIEMVRSRVPPDAVLPATAFVTLCLCWLPCIVAGRRFHAAMQQNIESLIRFRAESASCMLESDKQEVLETIRCLYGSELVFEEHVRKQMIPRLMNYQIPYWLHLCAAAPIFVSEALDGALIFDCMSWSFRLHHITGYLIHYVFYIPCVIWIGFEMCKWRLHTSSRTAEILVVAIIWLTFSVMVSLYITTIPFATRESIAMKIVLIIVGCVLLGLCLVVPTCRAGRDYYRHASSDEAWNSASSSKVQGTDPEILGLF